jgi:hypothetical protein
MGQTPSDRLATVADVAAAIEAAGNAITDLRVTVDDETGRGTARVSVPVVDTSDTPPCAFDLAAATLVDGTLHVELDVITDPSETTPSDEPNAPETATTATATENNTDQPPTADQSPTGSEHPPAERDTPDSTGDETAVEPDHGESQPAEHGATHPEAAETPEEATTSETAAHNETASAENQPAYRDPDQLAAVYEPEATFAEMTDALGVGVTPQTVRKYMIEHGIHEPTTRASDALAETEPDAGERRTEPTEVDQDIEPTEDAAGESPAAATAAEPAEPEATQQSSTDVEREATSGPTADVATGAHTPGQIETTTAAADQDANDPQAAAHTATETDEAAPTTPAATDQGGGETDDTTAVSPDEAPGENPESTSTATDGGTQPTRSAVESLELPAAVSAAELVSVLTDSRTVYEVRRGLGIDDGEARTLLRQYNLIGLVTGRITQGAEPPDKEEVLTRLLEASDQAA